MKAGRVCKRFPVRGRPALFGLPLLIPADLWYNFSGTGFIFLPGISFWRRGILSRPGQKHFEADCRGQAAIHTEVSALAAAFSI